MQTLSKDIINSNIEKQLILSVFEDFERRRRMLDFAQG